MKRFAAASLVLVLALMGVLLPAPALAQDSDRVAYFVSVVGDNGEIPSSARCRVMTASSNTNATIYTDGTLLTTASNPITMNTTSGECRWFAPGSVTSFDVLVLVDGGSYKGARVRAQAVTRFSNKQIVVQRSTAERILAIPFSRSTDSVQTTTSYTIPKGALLQEVLVETTTEVAASTINVGYGTYLTNLALCSAQSTATAGGFVNCAPTDVLMSESTAITYNTQDHDVAGYIWVKYLELAAGP